MSSAPLIAVVDDEELVRRALQRLLRASGVNVEAYADGQAFLDALSDHRPDCLVLDLHMPLVNGFQVLDEMAARRLRVPTVVITGHESAEAVERVLAAGASELLRKPIDCAVLLNSIVHAMESARSTTRADSDKLPPVNT